LHSRSASIRQTISDRVLRVAAADLWRAEKGAKRPARFSATRPTWNCAACWANLNLGQYDSAIALGERAAGVDTWYFNHLLLAAAYANKGDAAKAAMAKADFEKRVPGYTISILKSKGYSSHPNYVQQAEAHLYPGLRKAGIPEQ
jgi:hypothetical protein